MKIKFFGWIYSYYFIVLLLVAGFIVYGIRHLALNEDKVFSVYEGVVRFDKLEEEKPFAEVKNLINFARLEDISRIIATWGKEVQYLNSVVPLDSYKKLESNLEEFGAALRKLPSSDQLLSLQGAFYQKVSNIEKLANERNWGELERVSKRLGAKIKNSEFFGFSNMSRLSKNIDGDLNSINGMIEKKSILKTINFDKEENFLNQYFVGMKGVNLAWSKIDKNYMTWKNEFSPEISLRKIDLNKNLKNVFWGTIFLLTFIVFALGGGWFVGRILEKSVRRKFELFTAKIVKEGLFPVEKNIDIELSPSFEEHFEKLREYFHKRLGFGAMVQEAMPFPVLLLDSNLNLLWANKLFYEKWNLENNEIPLSWDYLSQFTDLGEENPVLTALNQEVSGIYNIRVLAKSSDEDNGESVEMYVRPVGYGKKKRVMVLFYPLNSLEATLADKTKDIIRPVVKTLGILEKGEYTPHMEETMEKDFNDAGIGDVFTNFHSHYCFLKNQREELRQEMGKVEGILDEQYKLASEFKMLLKSDEEVVVQSLQSFSRFKNSLINIIGMRERLEEVSRKSIHMAQKFLEENEKVLSGSEQMIESINKNKAIFQSLIVIGEQLKKIENSEELSSNIQRLNVTLAKAAMLLENDQTPELSLSVRQIRRAGDFFQEGMENLDKMREEFGRADDMMITCLKEFYTSFKGLQENMAKMGQYVGKLDHLNKSYTTTSTV